MLTSPLLTKSATYSEVTHLPSVKLHNPDLLVYQVLFKTLIQTGRSLKGQGVRYFLWLKKHNTRKVQEGVRVNSYCGYLCPVAKLDLPKRLSKSLSSLLVEFLFCLVPSLCTTNKDTLYRSRARCVGWKGGGL